MSRLLVVTTVALTGCLDSLTLLPLPEPSPPPKVTSRDAGAHAFFAGALAPVEVVSAMVLVAVDAGAGVEDAGVTGVVDAGAPDAGAPDAGCACPMVAHAESLCVASGCARGPCEFGFFDLDLAVPGCESTCTQTSCTGPSGVITLTAPPVHERALGVFSSTGVRTDESRGDLGAPGALSGPHRPLLH